MVAEFRRFNRWIKFHYVYRRTISTGHGIISLCDNYYHPYYDSKFEAKTCNVLSEFFPKKNILVPEQHKYSIKFDFIIPKIAIVEPHGIWTDSAEGSTYFGYYQQRQAHASKHNALKDLPMVVISNDTELDLLKQLLQEFSNTTYAVKAFIKQTLEKYGHTTKPIDERPYEGYITVYSLITVTSVLIGWGLAILFAYLWWTK